MPLSSRDITLLKWPNGVASSLDHSVTGSCPRPTSERDFDEAAASWAAEPGTICDSDWCFVSSALSGSLSAMRLLLYLMFAAATASGLYSSSMMISRKTPGSFLLSVAR